MQVRVEELEDMHVAYVRHTGSHKGDEALFRGLFDRLMK
jgi:AraC family transcriptional regulator